MPKSTPDDLAVAFRSIARRLGEALEAAEDAPVGGLVAELDARLGAAATLVGSRSTGAAIADAIAARPSAEWDEYTLDALRQHAIDAGVVLRRIAESGQSG